MLGSKEHDILTKREKRGKECRIAKTQNEDIHCILRSGILSQKYINTCTICGHKGYSPVIKQDSFCNCLRNKAVYEELTKTLRELELDEWGRCVSCAQVQDGIH